MIGSTNSSYYPNYSNANRCYNKSEDKVKDLKESEKENKNENFYPEHKTIIEFKLIKKKIKLWI